MSSPDPSDRCSPDRQLNWMKVGVVVILGLAFLVGFVSLVWTGGSGVPVTPTGGGG